MYKVKLTSKRQATFPSKVCEDLGIQPGDSIELESQVQEGQTVWVLKKPKQVERPWLGMLREQSQGKTHPSKEDIESALAEGLTEERDS